jgi:hypothetical protein
VHFVFQTEKRQSTPLLTVSIAEERFEIDAEFASQSYRGHSARKSKASSGSPEARPRSRPPYTFHRKTWRTYENGRGQREVVSRDTP